MLCCCLSYGLKGRRGFAVLKQTVTAVSKATNRVTAISQYIGILIGSKIFTTSSSNIFFPFIGLMVRDGIISRISVLSMIILVFGLFFDV